MAETAPSAQLPPKLRPGQNGGVEPSSLADLVEWFLAYDERTSRMRHPMVEELFQWKQADDQANGVATYPFENADARFAIGVFQALEGVVRTASRLWLNQQLYTIARPVEISEAYKLDENAHEHCKS